MTERKTTKRAPRKPRQKAAPAAEAKSEPKGDEWVVVRFPGPGRFEGTIGATRLRGYLTGTDVSIWRPPWFDTMMASAPISTARRASSTLMTPFRQKGPPHFARKDSASFQFMDWSSILAK